MPTSKKTKTAPVKRATPPKDPNHCTYLIKKVDRVIWGNMVKRAKEEGRSLAWLFHEWIRKYADGE